MPKRHLTEDDTDNEEGEEIIGRRKSRRRTWLGARHLALNAEGQLQLQQLNSQYDSILASHSLLSTQTVMLTTVMMLMARIRRVSLGELIRSNRCFYIMLGILAASSGRQRLNLEDTQQVIDDLTILRRSDYTHPSIPPKIRRTIDSLRDDTEAELYTRFTKAELHELFLHLRLPTERVEINEHMFTSEEIFLLTLTFLAKGETFNSMRDNFGGDSNFYGSMVYWFVDHIFSTFYHKITGDSLRMWMKDVDMFRKKVWENVCFVKDEHGKVTDERILDISFHLWRVWSFIDCTYLRTNRPGSGPINDDGDRRESAQLIQQAFFTYV